MKKLFVLCVLLLFAGLGQAQTLAWSASSGPTTYATFRRDTTTDAYGNVLGKLSIDVSALPSNLHIIDMECYITVFGDGTETYPDQSWDNHVGPPSYLPLTISSLDQCYGFNPYPGFSVQVEYDWSVIYQDDDNNIINEYLSERYYY